MAVMLHFDDCTAKRRGRRREALPLWFPPFQHHHQPLPSSSLQPGVNAHKTGSYCRLCARSQPPIAGTDFRH